MTAGSSPASAPPACHVVGAYTDAKWQALTVGSSASDDAKVAAAAASDALRGELSSITNAEYLVVLAGSGCSLGVTAGSAGAVAPKMYDLWLKVKGTPAFGGVEHKLSRDIVASENLEHVLSEAQARLALDPTDADLSLFVSQAENIVWESCNFVDSDSGLAGHELFLRKVARRSVRLQRTQIFTTNYDRAFEEAAGRSRFNVIDGFGYGNRDFDGGSFDLDYVRRRPNDQLTLEPNVFHLLKLHGSVDWSDDGGEIRKSVGRPANPVLIYPSATKYQLSYRQPYLEFMSRFQIALRQHDVGLIVAGFGFNDDHLNAPIEAALRANIGLRAIVVTPGACAPSRSPSITLVEDLIKRGDRRLTLLEGTFADLVRYLPEVPRTEDRDSHADRFAKSKRPGANP